MKLISIIVPVYNSALFMDQLLEAIDNERKVNNWNLELVLVDDGSSDKSFLKIIELSARYHFIKGIKLSRNFGHQLAVKTGLFYATGDYIAIIDDDLQDPPSLLPLFFSKLDEGFEVAYGVRRKRKEPWYKKISYSLFYHLLDFVSDFKIPLNTGDFCVMTKKVRDNMLLLDEQNPYLRGIRAWVGFKQIGVEYERSKRIEGESGYSLKKLFKIAFDGIFSFSSLPLKIISSIGILGLFVSFTYSFYLFYDYLNHGIYVRGFNTIIIMLLFFSSLIIISIGVIGEYIFRIYNEVRRRPYSVIDQTINI